MSPLFILPPLLSLVLIFGGSALVLRTVLDRRDTVARRVALVSSQAPAKQGVTDRPPPIDPYFFRVTHASLQGPELAEVLRLARRVGIPPQNAATAFMTFRVLLALFLAGAAYYALNVLWRAEKVPLAAILLLPVIGAALGWFLPVWFVRGRGKSRAKEIVSGLPEALELLVICVEAGLSLEDGLTRITQELRTTLAPLAEEFEIMTADLNVLADRDKAFQNLADRVGAPEVRSVVTSLSQTLRYGTPLAGALRVAANGLRNDTLMSLEERANRLPSMLTVPMMLFIMPTIFMVVAGPAALRLIDMFAQ